MCLNWYIELYLKVLAVSVFPYAWKRGSTWWFKRRVPADCQAALGGLSQWAYKLGPVSDPDRCRTIAAGHERTTTELIRTIRGETPPSPADVQLLAKRIAAVSNNHRLDIPGGIEGEHRLLLNQAKRNAVAESLRIAEAPPEPEPTQHAVEIVKRPDGSVRLIAPMPHARHLLAKLNLTEEQLSAIDAAGPGQVMPLNIEMLAAPLEEAPAGLLVDDASLNAELERTKQRLLVQGQLVEGDLLRRAAALIAKNQAEHEGRRLAATRDSFDLALEPESVPAPARKLIDLPRLYVEAKKGDIDAKQNAIQHFIEVTGKHRLDQVSIDDRDSLICDHQQKGRLKRGHKHWKDSTFATQMRHLNSMFTWAVHMQWAKKNPVLGWSSVWTPERSSSDEADEKKGFTIQQLQQVDRLVVHGAITAKDDLHLWILQRCFGGRIAEFAGLRHCDFRYVGNRKCIFIVRHPLRSLKNDKTKKILPVPSCLEWLWDRYSSDSKDVVWPRFHSVRKDKAGRDCHEWATSYAGRVGRWMKKYAADNGLIESFPPEFWTTKVFRRSIGSILRECQGDDAVSTSHIDLLRGHADGSIARIYDDIEIGQVERATEIYARVTGFDKIALGLSGYT